MQLLQIQCFDPGTRPRRPAQKFEAGWDTGVVTETSHWYGRGHRLPAEAGGKLGDDGFESDPVQGVRIGLQLHIRYFTVRAYNVVLFLQNVVP